MVTPTYFTRECEGNHAGVPLQKPQKLEVMLK